MSACLHGKKKRENFFLTMPQPCLQSLAEPVLLDQNQTTSCHKKTGHKLCKLISLNNYFSILKRYHLVTFHAKKLKTTNFVVTFYVLVADSNLNQLY